MTIKRIKILNLFNTFNHEIRFNKNVTIIMGENGVGKTITLRLIDAIFSRRLDYLIDKEFSEIVITFHKETWHILRTVEQGSNYPIYHLRIKSSRKGASVFEVDSEMLMPRIPSHLERTSEDTWYNKRTGVFVSINHIIDRYGNGPMLDMFPEWYLHQCAQNRINLIKTQRLYQESEQSERIDHQVLSVEKYSQELSLLMQEVISKAAKSTGDLDRTFPKRLLRQMRSNRRYSSSEILEELHKLERHRLELSDLGLLTETEAKDTIISELDEKDTTMISVLHLYVKDSWEKLRQYDTLYAKLSLLKEIINSHFKHKVFSVDSLKGFVITPEDKKNAELVPVRMLSSGEQNELVLFYELLFKCDDRDLILIDEPEISLHLDWLQKMIGDIKRITDTSNASLLIATHSPDFVGDNYELVQNLA